MEYQYIYTNGRCIFRQRIILERFELQKNLEELKCSNNADSTSRSPSDLSDLDALEIVSPEIRLGRGIENLPSTKIS